jgi:hypothetical protein
MALNNDGGIAHQASGDQHAAHSDARIEAYHTIPYHTIPYHTIP